MRRGSGFYRPGSGVVAHAIGNVAFNPVRHLTPHDTPARTSAIKVAVPCAVRVCRSEALMQAR
jgi:hypothetical protein